MSQTQPTIRQTTILTVRRGGEVAIAGDGQVTIGQTAIKHDANKIRRLAAGKVLCGFAGSTADAFALLERFETTLEQYKGNTKRAAIELAKAWRTDKILRRLKSMMIVADAETSLLISGVGDVLEPSDGVIGIGTGGMYAAAAAKALIEHSSLSARQIAETSLRIAGEICVYTNTNITVEVL